MTSESRPVNISAAFRVMHDMLRINDWQSAGIIAKYIRDRAHKENLAIDEAERCLLVTAMAAHDATQISDADLHHDGYPDDSDRDPNTGIPYGEID